MCMVILQVQYVPECTWLCMILFIRSGFECVEGMAAGADDCVAVSVTESILIGMLRHPTKIDKVRIEQFLMMNDSATVRGSGRTHGINDSYTLLWVCTTFDRDSRHDCFPAKFGLLDL